MQKTTTNLEYLIETKENIKSAIRDKGVEVAEGDVFRTYDEKIRAIEAGSSNFACLPFEVDDGEIRKAIKPFKFIAPGTSITWDYALQYVFDGCEGLTYVEFPDLKYIGGYQALYNAFCGCTSLKEVKFPNLVSITEGYALEYAFYGCSSLTSLEFPKLSEIRGNCIFQNCFPHTLTSLSFPALTSKSFGSSTSQFNRMIQPRNCTIHFPQNIESIISSWPDIRNKFGTTEHEDMSVTILFDLPATE